MRAKCIIDYKDAVSKEDFLLGIQSPFAWREEFDVTSEETAQIEAQDIVSSFNETLKPGEKPRVLVKVLEVYDDSDNRCVYCGLHELDCICRVCPSCGVKAFSKNLTCVACEYDEDLDGDDEDIDDFYTEEDEED